MLQTLSYYMKGKRLRLCSSLFESRPVSHYSGKFHHLGDPAAIFLLFSLYDEIH